MYDNPMISLDQAQDAIEAMIDDYNKDPNRRKVDMAVVDDAGNLLAYARMDRCLRPTFGIRKAYTSAVRSMDTVAFAEQVSAQGRSLAISSGLGMRPLMERVLSRREILKA
jgi:uncharacterized protein GlcG (DUF336 family)